jgi:hypothetical protein
MNPAPRLPLVTPATNGEARMAPRRTADGASRDLQERREDGDGAEDPLDALEESLPEAP